MDRPLTRQRRVDTLPSDLFAQFRDTQTLLHDPNDLPPRPFHQIVPILRLSLLGRIGIGGRRLERFRVIQQMSNGDEDDDRVFPFRRGGWVARRQLDILLLDLCGTLPQNNPTHIRDGQLT